MGKYVLVEDDKLDLAYEKVNLAFSVSENVLKISINEQLVDLMMVEMLKSQQLIQQ